MKMVKSLLLGTAAGLVAMTGAQAADLPVKAKPVQYVKICSLYGAGFYYIPGTDMCLKVGGWVRAEYAYGDNGNMTWGWANGAANSRSTSNTTFRHRGYITADARNQSEYGTIRSYIAVGINTNSTGLDNAANQFSANRAFVQLAGFTFGLSQSFFDFYSTPATSLWGSFPGTDTGDPGWGVAAYTAQFGNGLSATISAEQRRMTQIIYQDSAGFSAAGTVAPGGFLSGITYGNSTFGGGLASNTTGGLATGAGAYGGFQMPDVVANLRIDQAWGSAQVMGAIHQVNSTYYNGVTAAAGTGANVVANGHPSDSYGYVVGAGLKLNAPMIGAGDYLQAQVNYTVGALGYIFQTPKGNWGGAKGAQEGFGVVADSVYGGTIANVSNTGNDLTTAWNVNAAYEHFWNKQWRTSAYGGYAAVSYATEANNMLCNIENNLTAAAVSGSASAVVAGCNNNWSTWWLGSRSQWNVTPDTYLAVDVLYSKMKSANAGGPLGLGVNAAANTAGRQSLAISGSSASAALGGVADIDNWAFRFRVHKDFYP